MLVSVYIIWLLYKAIESIQADKGFKEYLCVSVHVCVLSSHHTVLPILLQPFLPCLFIIFSPLPSAILVDNLPVPKSVVIFCGSCFVKSKTELTIYCI